MRNRAIGLGQGADVFRKKHNRSIQRDKKIKKIKLKSMHTLVIILMLCGIGFAAYQGTLLLLSWEQLRINAFHLTNAQQLDPVELEGILNKYNVNIFSIEFAKLRRDLHRFKILKKVEFSRKLPTSIAIKFFYRSPLIQLVKGDSFLTFDEEGVLMAEGEKRMPELILAEDFETEDMPRIAAVIQDIPEYLQHIERIQQVPPYGLSIKLKYMKEIIYPGETDISRKINTYFSWKRKLDLDRYQPRYVDLRFEDRFYFGCQHEETGK